MISELNYYEHVIRNEKALHNIRKYIEDNPLIERIRFEEFYINGSDTRLPSGRNPTPTRIRIKRKSTKDF